MGSEGADAAAAAIDGPAADAGVAAKALELFVAGGPVVAVLAVMSVIAAAIVVLKLWQFWSARLWDRGTARRALALLRSGESAEAMALAATSRNPAAQVLAMAIRGRARPDIPEATVREELVRAAGEMLESLRAYFRPLEVIATLAPLLGLFGTVLGMIAAFQQLESAGNRINPAILSGGIWEALLTTAVGLAVAIPVVAIINWLERLVDRLAHEMESTVTQVFTDDLSRDPPRELDDAPHTYRPTVAGAAE